MTTCLSCNEEIQPFMSFGKMPIANGFLKPECRGDEYKFKMEVGFCSQCYMFQLINQPEREKMFNENYAFFSGTSKNMAVHFQAFADSVIADHLACKNDPFVVEIGSNDGIMLRNFADKGIRHLGIEPSTNVAQVALKRGINTVSEFFDCEYARKIVEMHGKADAFLAANVMCHIPYVHSIVEGIKILLKDDGLAMFEDPYLGDVISNTSYDQIYDEHVFLFSAHSVRDLFSRHGMDLVDVEPQPTHGGSMRYTLARAGARPVSERVTTLLAEERSQGLDAPETFNHFRRSCERYRDELTTLVRDIRSQGHRIVGYAATSKSTTIINYCGLTSDDIEFISDTTPIKQGKLSPGAHIPVKSHDAFVDDYPPYALLFAYNHRDEIMEKEKEYVKSGGKWILYFPEVTVQ